MRFTPEEIIEIFWQLQESDHANWEWQMKHDKEVTEKLVEFGWIHPPEPKRTREQIAMSLWASTPRYDMSITCRSDLGRKRGKGRGNP